MRNCAWCNYMCIMETADYETAAQLFSRLGAKESLSDLNIPLFKNVELQPGDIVEFCGTEGTGKTELLLHIAAMCVLPKSWYGVSLPGHGVDIVFISTDYQLDLKRLATIMECIALSHGDLTAEQMNCKQLITSSLKRLHVVYATSMEELVITLISLKTFLDNHPNVCALLLDHVATFWWVEKAMNPVVDCEPRWTCAVNEVIREYHLVMFATRPLLAKEVYSSYEMATPDEVLNRYWYKMVKFRFFLQKATEQENSFSMTTVYQQSPPRVVCRLYFKSTGIKFLSSGHDFQSIEM